MNYREITRCDAVADDVEYVPKVPLLPFATEARFLSYAKSSTICGTPTPQSGGYTIESPAQIPDLVRHSSVHNVEGGNESNSSPRIERSSVVAIDSSVCIATDFGCHPRTPACGRLYEFRYPPMPRFNSIYKEAKKAEYDGDYEKAMALYLKAIEAKDRPDSAMKDYAGILHMRGRTSEAIRFLEQRGDKFKSSLGYKNLLTQLKAFLQTSDSEKRNLPRSVYVAIGDDMQTKLAYSSLPSIFPNYLKISSIIFVNPLLDDSETPQSSKAIIEFASHSAARKALMVVKHAAIKCQWLPEGLVDSDERIVRVSAADVSLETIGPIVSVYFAIVPESIVTSEWPTKLIGRSVATPVGDVQVTTNAAVSPLTLPVIRRSESPPKTPRRAVTASHCLELDIASIESTARGTPSTIDWCLNTPSPVRHVALLF